MIKLRTYIDTSVIGGCLDSEFMADSVQLFNQFISGVKIPVVSDLLLFELESAPAEVRNIMKKIPAPHVEYASLDEESMALADAYVRDGAVAEKNLADARHIAIASVERVDVLVSWNFKHIVNIGRIRLLNSVNLKLGYSILDIRSPKEVLYEENQEI